MAEIKEIRDAMRKKKRNRNILRICTVIILLALVVTVFINRDNLTPEAISNWLSNSLSADGEDEGFPVSLPSGETVSLVSAGSNVVMTNQTNLYFYSQRGKLLRNVQHSCKSVQSKVGGSNVLVYSVGDKKVRVETASKTAVEMESDNPVTMGEIAKNGRFVIATESDVYTSEMIVYDKNANAIFKWTPSGAVISSVGISSDGHYAAAATLYTQGGKIISGIHLFSTGKNEPLVSYSIEDEIVLSLSCSSDSVQIITDRRAVTINKSGEEKGKYSFDEKKVIDIEKSANDTAIVFRDVNDPGKSVLVVINEKSDLLCQSQVDGAVIYAAATNSKVYLLTDEKILSYDSSSAKKTGECDIEHDALRLCATSAGPFVITSACELIRPEVK